MKVRRHRPFLWFLFFMSPLILVLIAIALTSKGQEPVQAPPVLGPAPAPEVDVPFKPLPLITVTEYCGLIEVNTYGEPNLNGVRSACVFFRSQTWGGKIIAWRFTREIGAKPTTVDSFGRPRYEWIEHWHDKVLRRDRRIKRIIKGSGVVFTWTVKDQEVSERPPGWKRWKGLRHPLESGLY